MGSVFERLLFGASVFAAIAFAAPARADGDCLVETHGVGLGFVIPSRGCVQTVDADIFLSAVSGNFKHFGPRGTVELGYLHQVPGIDDWHLGGVFGVSGTDLLASNSSLSAVDFTAGLRSRKWFGDWFLFDAAAGPMVSRAVETGHVRPGGFVEVGMSVHGAGGFFFDVEPTWDPIEGKTVMRYAIGGKTTLVGFAILVYGVACGLGGGHC